jgi:hypothetical protein
MSHIRAGKRRLVQPATQGSVHMYQPLITLSNLHGMCLGIPDRAMLEALEDTSGGLSLGKAAWLRVVGSGMC